MKDRFVIFAGGEPVSREALDMDFISSAVVIGADRGYELAEGLGVVPDIILGDFDSAAKRPDGDKVTAFPVDKDDTDLMLAVKKALDLGARAIQIYGAMGGRLDHLLGNLSCACLAVRNGCGCEIISDNDIYTLLSPGEHRIKAIDGFSLSLIAYSERVEGLTVSGTKYLAENVTLTSFSTLGISNVITDGFAQVSFKSGLLAAVRSRL